MKSPLVRYSLLGALIWLVMFYGSFALVWLKVITTYDYGQLIGYSGMVLSLAMIFFALIDQRDRMNGGQLSFGQGFRLGMLITVIVGVVVGLSDVFYTSVLNPNFYAEYMAHMEASMRAKGMSAEQIAAKAKAAQEYAFFLSPMGAFLLMFVTVVMIGLLISVVSALLVRRRAVRV